MTEERTLASFRADDRIIIKKDDLIAWINDNHIFSEEELNRKANAIIEEMKRRRENRAERRVTLFVYFYAYKITLFLEYTHRKITLFLGF